MSDGPLAVERLERRLEALWERGERPDVYRFLAEAGTAAPAEVAAALALDQWRRWHSGERVRAEEYLERCPAVAADTEAALALIHGELLVREELGERPDPGEYLQRFPRLADRLRKQFAFHKALGASGPSSASSVAGGSAPRAAARPPTVAGYEILGELGRGGMGVVYKARQVKLDRVVALKMILAGVHADPEGLARFRAEAEAVARLQHPHIVQVYEVGEVDGRPFFSLEYCAGGSLQKELEQAPQPPRTAAQLAATLALAMQYAHERGIVHRDLKPANILLSRRTSSLACPSEQDKQGCLSYEGDKQGCLSYEAKITDFGLAKQVDVDAGQTQSGAIVGTPDYMAPEQAAGKVREVGPAADVYALGAILYECLTGRPPFQAASLLETLIQVQTRDPLPPRRLQPAVPRDLETICLKCLQKAPRQRYASAGALAADLGRFLKGLPIAARPVPLWEHGVKWARRRPAVAGLTLLALLVTVLGFMLVTAQWSQAEVRRQQAETAETDARTRQLAARQARDEANGARTRAEADKRAADAARTNAETKLYFNSIALADQAFWGRQLGRAAELLDQCPPNLCRWEWNYLRRLCHSARFEVLGEDAVAYSPDGALLASSGSWGVVKIWAADDGRGLRSLRGHQGGVYGLAFSRDSRYLASASSDATVKVWDVATGKIVWSLSGHKGVVASVAFSPDGGRLASAGADGIVRVWDVASGKELHSCRGHQGSVAGVAFSPDGKLLASGGFDTTVRIWEPATGRAVRTLRGRSAVQSLAYSPDGTQVATAVYAGVQLWDPATGRFLRHMHTHPRQVHAVAFNSDGQRLAAGNDDGSVLTVHPVTGANTRRHIGYTGAVRGVAFSPDGGRLAAAGRDSLLRVWDVKSSQGARVLANLPGQATSVAVSPDRKHVAITCTNGEIKIWDAFTWQEVNSWKVCDDIVYGAAYSADGGRLATAGGDRVVRIWDPRTGRELLACRGHTDDVKSVAFRPDGKQLASTTWGSDPTLFIWDAATGRKIRSLPGGRTAVYSPDGKYLASVWTAPDFETTALWAEVRVWEAESGRAVRTFRRPETSLFALGFSPDSRKLAAAGGEVLRRRDLYLWDIASGEELLTVRVQGRANLCVGFAPDGQRVVTGGLDNTVSLWDTASGREVLALQGHMYGILGVAFTADGRALLSASGDRTVRLWDGRAHSAPRTMHAHSDAVTCGQFRPDGRLFAVASADRTVSLWDTGRWGKVGTLRGHTGSVREVVFSRDGLRLATASRDGLVKIWDVSPGRTPAEAGPVGKVLHTLRTRGTAVLAVAFDPTADGSKGRRVASGTEDGTVEVWDADTGAASYTLPRMYNYILRLRFSPDGKLLAVAGGNQPTVKLLDAATGRTLRTLTGHEGLVVNQVEFSPDGKFLVSAGGDGTVRVWDVATGREAVTCRGHDGPVYCVACSPDGKLLASAGTDWGIKIWDAATGQCRQTWYAHTGNVTSVAFSPDGRSLTSGSYDETVRVWPLPPDLTGQATAVAP